MNHHLNILFFYLFVFIILFSLLSSVLNDRIFLYKIYNIFILLRKIKAIEIRREEKKMRSQTEMSKWNHLNSIQSKPIQSNSIAQNCVWYEQEQTKTVLYIYMKIAWIRDEWISVKPTNQPTNQTKKKKMRSVWLNFICDCDDELKICYIIKDLLSKSFKLCFFWLLCYFHIITLYQISTMIFHCDWCSACWIFIKQGQLEKRVKLLLFLFLLWLLLLVINWTRT